MSDIPVDSGDPAEVEDLENPEIEDAEVEEVDAAGDDGEVDADVDGEVDEGQAQGQTRDVAPRGKPKGRPYGEQIRALEAQRAADKAEFDRRLEALMAERRQPTPAEMQAAAEAERQAYEMMPPYEQHLYTQRKINEGVQQQTQQILRANWEQNDRRETEAFLAANPKWRGLERQVEELKRQAPNVPTKILYWTAYGKRAEEQAGPANRRAARAGEAVAARQTARPSNGRADVSPERGRRGDDLDERLRNQAI